MDTDGRTGSGQCRVPTARAEDGFTLIELTVGMVMFGILAVLGTSGWLSYQRNVEHRGSAQELVSALRKAQQSSLAEAVTYCVRFDPAQRSYQVYKFVCGSTGTPVGPAQTTQSARVGLVTPAFVQLDGTATATLSFFPRGSATKGSLVVDRVDSDRTYTISVEGLTGRVSLSD